MTIDLSRVHMIGIGGSGMSGIARILLARGYQVTGSDMKESRVLLALRAAGAHVEVGHRAENLRHNGELPTVVVTSFAAIPQDNPEIVAAKEAGITVLRRSDVLALLMEERRAFLLAGTHGKTSSTSFAVAALQAGGMDPSFAIGGQLNRAGTNAHHGSDEVFVAEADESDGSFLSYCPEVAVITNIEPDHLDYFGTEEEYYRVFRQFAERMVEGGYLVLCADDAGARDLAVELATAAEQGSGHIPAPRCTVLLYGTESAVDSLTSAHPNLAEGASITNVAVTSQGTVTTARFCLPEQQPREVQFLVRTPGMHMALNATAALLGAALLGGDLGEMKNGISSFDGVRRRFEYHGDVCGFSVYDDYAHHPTEVSAVLSAAREKISTQEQGRIIAVFQPHLYSRTMNFAREFAAALDLADEVILLDIFGARENPVEGVDSRIIGQHLHAPWHYQRDFSAVPQQVLGIAQEGDIVLTIGAGTVTMLADEILLVGNQE